MRNDTNTIRFGGYEDPKHGRQVTRLYFRGWMVDVDRGAVTVPRQPTAGKVVADLAVCLDAADTLARKNHSQRQTSAPTRQPAPPADALVAVLRGARQIATDSWQTISNDIYACVRQAWEDADMTVPYAALLAPLRAVLPAGQNLMGFNDDSVHSQICALFDNAIAYLLATRGGTGDAAAVQRGVA